MAAGSEEASGGRQAAEAAEAAEATGATTAIDGVSAPSYRTRVSILRPHPVLRFVGPSLIVASLAGLLVAAGAHALPIVMMMPWFAFLGLALTVAGARTRRGWSDVPGELEVENGEVRFDGKTLAARGTLKTGLVVPYILPAPLVRLTTGPLSPAIDLRVRDEAHGREVLRALGMDATQRAAVFRLPSQALSTRGGLWATILVIGLLTTVAGFAAGALHAGETAVALFRPVFAAVILAVMLATRTKLTVGADGVLVEGLGRRRFVRHGDVLHASPWEDGFMSRRWQGVRLTLRSGEDLRLVCNRSGSFDGASAAPRSRLVLERIREAMESARRGDPAHEGALLARNARDASAWIHALRGLGAGAVDLRTAPIPEERLWRLVEDAAAPAITRASAAVALGPSLDGEGRARVRVAAQATASPKLRVALEAATAADDAALAEALDEVEAEEAEVRR